MCYFIFYVKRKGIFNNLKFCCCLFTESCPALSDPMDYSPPGSSVHGIFQSCHFLLQGIFLNQGSNPHLLHWQTLAGRLFTTEPPGKPIFKILVYLQSRKAVSNLKLQIWFKEKLFNVRTPLYKNIYSMCGERKKRNKGEHSSPWHSYIHSIWPYKRQLKYTQ